MEESSSPSTSEGSGNVTKGGKVIEMFVVPQSSRIALKFTTGGELPRCLTGQFTNRVQAQKAIDAYLG